MCDCLSCGPHWGPGPQPRHVPWLVIEPATFWFTARNQSTELHQPGKILKPKIGRTQTRINYPCLPGYKTVIFKRVRNRKIRGETNLYWILCALHCIRHSCRLELILGLRFQLWYVKHWEAHSHPSKKKARQTLWPMWEVRLQGKPPSPYLKSQVPAHMIWANKLVGRLN